MKDCCYFHTYNNIECSFREIWERLVSLSRSLWLWAQLGTLVYIAFGENLQQLDVSFMFILVIVHFFLAESLRVRYLKIFECFRWIACIYTRYSIWKCMCVCKIVYILALGWATPFRWCVIEMNLRILGRTAVFCYAVQMFEWLFNEFISFSMLYTIHPSLALLSSTVQYHETVYCNNHSTKPTTTKTLR